MKRESVMSGAMVFALAAMLAGVQAIGGAADYYVAPDGKDSNPGTKAAPFKTFKPAVTAAAPGDTIYARGGTYTDDNNMIYTRKWDPKPDVCAMVALKDYSKGTVPPFTVRDGLPDKPITLKNYPGEKPVFSGLHPNIHIHGKSYWVIEGLEIDGTINGNTLKNADSLIHIDGGDGWGKETHDITIQNNDLHDLCTDPGSNPGVIKIDRGWQSGAYSICIRNNHIYGVWSSGKQGGYSGIAVLSAQKIEGYDQGGTGYIEITGNEMDHLPQVFLFKSAMVGPVEIHGNIMHDSGCLGKVNTSNMRFNHNLCYDIPQGFWRMGEVVHSQCQPSSEPRMCAIYGQNAIVQHNTFVGLSGLMGIEFGTGHYISNNIFFGKGAPMKGANWGSVGYITKLAGEPDLSKPASPSTSILQMIHSDNNCFIVPDPDFVFVARKWTDGTPLEFNDLAAAQKLYRFDRNSKLIVESNPAKIFKNPAAHDYRLIDPSICPGMGVGDIPPLPPPSLKKSK